MTVEWEQLGRRVREARFARQLDQTALAVRVRLERSALAKVEAGTRKVSALELAALGEALSLPLSYFVTESPAAMVSRRQPLESAATEVERVRFQTDLLLEQHLADVEQLRALGYLPRAHTPSGTVGTRDEAIELAGQARGLLGVGSDPLGPMADVAGDFGLWLLVVDEGLEGASMTPEPGLGAGVLGSGSDPGRRRFTAAHELGHHLAGDEYASDISVAASRDEREEVIDAFAQALLLPVSAAQEFLRAVPEEPLRDVLTRLAATYRTSWTMTLRVASHAAPERGDELDRLRGDTPSRADLIRVTGAPVREDLTSGQTASSWQQAVLAAHRDSKISGARAIELLHGALALDDLPDVDAAAPL